MFSDLACRQRTDPEGKKRGGKGTVCQAVCPATGRVGGTWIPHGAVPATPTIAPEPLARRAVDSMRLDGPNSASPRASGRYTVGVLMWLWVRQSPPTYGPASVTASAGGVTVTATARVTEVRWGMDDGATVTCTGLHHAGAGMTDSPRLRAPLHPRRRR
ncbi:hypothetical protein [Streptomyces sp. JNUCC 63]